MRQRVRGDAAGGCGGSRDCQPGPVAQWHAESPAASRERRSPRDALFCTRTKIWHFTRAVTNRAMIPALPATRPLWLSATHYYSAETEVVACFPLSAAGAAEWQPPDAAAQPAQALSASVATPAGFGAGVGLARAAVALAATVAHPQGGGQPGDCGHGRGVRRCKTSALAW